MKINIKNNYLIFPVNTLAADKKLIFKKADKTVYELDIKLDNFNPDFYAYIDVSRFIGQTLNITVNPEMKLDFRTADEMDIDNLYSEALRPQIHFTAKNGWLNDPNGLICLDGIYHMFYQYNPAENKWGNMHWGHAVSKDLIHWKEQKNALFPDDRGTMFSGCAILDEKNLLGKNDNDSKAALLYYTTTSPFTQNISYSTDGFKTIEKYAGNPIIPCMEHGNRDPKVIFCDELQCYIMALYLIDDIFCILKSDDLVNWNEIQRLHLQGDNECPDIFPLTDEHGQRKWVFIGAHGRYLVGRFENCKFVAEQEIMPFHYGDTAYAAQTFSNLPNGRIVRMVWDRWDLPACGFNGQMGIPTEMSLSKFEDSYYLQATPVKEIESIYKTTACYKNIKIAPENNFCAVLEDTPYIFKINSKLNNCGKAELSIFGRTISLDFQKNEIVIGNVSAPVSITGANLDLTIIIDRCSIELFADSGKIYMSCLDINSVCDRNLPCFIIKTDSETVVEAIEMYSLNSIWS